MPIEKSVLVAAVNVEADPGSRLLTFGSPRLREATCFVAVKGQEKGNGDILRLALSNPPVVQGTLFDHQMLVTY